ncbi:MAG: phytoene/squalene synthase family protein [Haloferacaceae archaeon]
MIDTEQLDQSRDIQRRTGRNFHVATRLFPERVRHATYVLYGFFRVADDVVDDAEAPPPAEQRAELARIRAEALGERSPTDPVLAAFSDLRTQYDIDEREVEEFLAAMERDVETARYRTFAELERYLRGSAVAVAYMMLDVMGAVPERARPHARALGEAFQLTNFLRDVREDVLEYGRVYLPEATLTRHGASVADVEALRFSPAFADAMREELRRAEKRYWTGVEGIQCLPADCRFPVLLAAVLYADHHRLIRAQEYDVLSNRPTLSTRRRLSLAARTWWHWRRTDDPVAAFAAASSLGDDARDVASAGAGESARDDLRSVADGSGLRAENRSGLDRVTSPVRRALGALSARVPSFLPK